MKKILLAFAITSFLFASCEKKQNIIPVVPEQPAPEDSTYIINGITDFSLGRLDSTMVVLDLDYQQGKQEKITLSVEGLPDKVKAVFAPATGIPGFNTMLSIKSTLAKAGKYAVTIKGTSANGMVKSYKVDLVIRDNFACDTFLVNNTGAFKTTYEVATDSIFGFTYINSMFVSADSPMVLYLANVYLEEQFGNPVVTNGFSSPGLTDQVTFNYNCDNQTITLHEKTVTASTFSGPMQYKISGTGTINYDARTITINYMVTNPLNIEWEYQMTTKLFL